jgi:hypothetical protein
MPGVSPAVSRSPERSTSAAGRRRADVIAQAAAAFGDSADDGITFSGELRYGDDGDAGTRYASRALRKAPRARWASTVAFQEALTRRAAWAVE